MTHRRTDDLLTVKKRLNDVLDDLDLICRQIAELVTVPRDRRGFGASLKWTTLAGLFSSKTLELEQLWKVAIEQTERQRLIDTIQHEVHIRNEYIERLRNCFIESETVLMNAIFKANLKLKSIRQSEMRQVSPDELIKYAHRISAANSVSASNNWQIGDPERPFPTDVEMRSGWLSRISGVVDYNAASTAPAFMVPQGGVAAGGGHPSAVVDGPMAVVSAHGSASPTMGAIWPSSSGRGSSPTVKMRLGQPNLPSPSMVAAGRAIRSPMVQSNQTTIKRELSTADTVEALSSDSSSSSSSDSPS